MLAPILIILVFTSFLLLGGFLTSYVFNLKRLGYGSALFYGTWLVLSLAYAMPCQWSVHVGDITFLIMITSLLTFIYINRRALKKQKLPYDANDYIFWTIFLIGLTAPVLILPVPLDTDAQGFSYLALMTRLHGDLTNLSPFNPELDYLYAPGLSVTSAYLSERLGSPIHQTQFAISATTCLLFLICLYDFGLEIKDRIQAKSHMYACVIGTGLITAYMDSHFTTLLGLLFGCAFLSMIYLIATGKGHAQHILFASVLLSSLVLVHPDTTITIALGFGSWLLLMPFAAKPPSRRQWLIMTFLIPAIAFLLILPWFISVLPLIGSDIKSPFKIEPFHWKIILSIPPHLIYHGGLIVLLSLLGLCLTFKKRSMHTLLASGWLVITLDFSSFGILEYLFPVLLKPITKYHYAFNLAWHGPIIPYILLTGSFIVYIWCKCSQRIRKNVSKVQPYFFSFIFIALLIIIINNKSMLSWTKGRLVFFGAFSSHADVQAMTWLRKNTSKESVILNHCGPFEADWVPVISERKSIFFRPQHFFSNDNAKTVSQIELTPFWNDPANERHLSILKSHDVDYVLLPQSIGNPDSLKTHYRWRTPQKTYSQMNSRIDEASYLKLIKDFNGAQIYKVDYQKLSLPLGDQ